MFVFDTYFCIYLHAKYCTLVISKKSNSLMLENGLEQWKNNDNSRLIFTSILKPLSLG